jgi:hypothetical protein
MRTDPATRVDDPPSAIDDQADSAAEVTPVRPRDTRLGDRIAAGGYLLAALFVTVQLWLHPTSTMLRENRQDHIQFEWFLTNSVRTLRHLSDPFFTDMLNAPFGVNLMANTSVWGLSLPLAPITALFGAPISYRVLLTGVFFGTALAWYHLLSRYLVRSWVAAFVGGAFCAFAPGMLGQGTGHPNVVAQFLLPFIVIVVLRMREPGDSLRNGLLLAGLVTYQIFINEEVLLLAALAIAVFVLAYWVRVPAVVNRCLRGSLISLGVTAGVVAVVASYPLYRQFFGRQSYRGLPDWVLDYNTDPLSYVSYAQQSLAGSKAGAEPLAQGVAEQNTFYGWGLTALVVIAVVWMWRRPAVRALAVTGVTFLLFSLGRYVVVDNARIPGPWRVLAQLPLLDTVVPTRLSLVVIPVVGLLLAFFVERIMIEGAARGEGMRFWTPLRVVGTGALVVALLPIAPTPLTVSRRHPAPRFLASGAWRDHLPVGGTIGLLPFGWQSDLNMMQWQAEQGLNFKILNGYFLGPDPSRDDRRGQFNGGSYLVTRLLGETHTDRVAVTAGQRAFCLDELRRWHTTALVLPEDAPNADLVRDEADQIIGPGQHLQDVWIWRVVTA